MTSTSTGFLISSPGPPDLPRRPRGGRHRSARCARCCRSAFHDPDGGRLQRAGAKSAMNSVELQAAKMSSEDLDPDFSDTWPILAHLKKYNGNPKAGRSHIQIFDVDFPRYLMLLKLRFRLRGFSSTFTRTRSS